MYKKKSSIYEGCCGVRCLSEFLCTLVDKSMTWDDHVFTYMVYYFIERDVDSLGSPKFVDSINDIQGLLLIDNKINNRNS